MKREEKEGRARPGVVLLILFLTSVVLVSLWIFRTGSTSAPSAPEPQAVAEAPAAPQEAVEMFNVPQTRPERPGRHAKKSIAKPVEPAQTLEEHWGIQVASLRLSMGNSIIDLRYKILDPVKVAALARNKMPSYLLDQTSGKKLMMPTPPKEGAFPPTANRLVAGKTYFSMVSNQGGTLKSGSQVTVMVGGSEATNLTVE